MDECNLIFIYISVYDEFNFGICYRKYINICYSYFPRNSFLLECVIWTDLLLYIYRYKCIYMYMYIIYNIYIYIFYIYIYLLVLNLTKTYNRDRWWYNKSLYAQKGYLFVRQLLKENFWSIHHTKYIKLLESRCNYPIEILLALSKMYAHL